MNTTKKMFTFLVTMLMILSVFATTSVASADDPALVPGPNITADPASPTGYTVTFVYYNPNATGVRLAGDLTLLDVNTGPSIRYQPEEWQLGRYHVGGVEFTRDMTEDADGYWSATIPMHAGGLSYWYRVDDPTQGWTNHRIWDPAGTHPRPTIDPTNPIFSTPFRIRNNNDVLGAVYVPLDAEKQNDPTLISRATYELPIADPAQRGTVQYIPYTTILGDYGYHLGVYLPAGYDANRAKPYKVIYFAHGIFGDETDGMIPGNMPNILDNMIARGEIEPTVLVTMGNHFTGTSLSFFSYNLTNAANNLVQVILPFIEANYNVSNKPEGRAFGGFSYGGSTGGIVIKTYPTTFGYYGFFSGNPSLTTADYDNIAAAVGANNLFVFLGNGFFEGSLSRTDTIRDNFRTREIYSETAQVNGAHDMMTAGMLFTIFARDYLWTLPAQQIASLKEAVAGMVTGGIEQALTVKLDQALKLLAKDKPSEAVSILKNDFIGQVNDLTGVKLTEEQAAELITAAEQIISTIMDSN
jgi:enterochelin esterase-like enzyme